MPTYKVTLCKTEPYTDSNNIHWWNKEEFTPEVILSKWKQLEGYSNEVLVINKVFIEDNFIMAEAESPTHGIEGKYLSPSIRGYVDKGEVIAVEDITLCEIFLSEDYSFGEALPLTEIIKQEDE